MLKKYIQHLFSDNRPAQPDLTFDDSGPDILKDEVRYVISLMKNGKSPGPDEIHAELLKLLDENGINVLTDVFNLIYKTGQIPSDWLKSTFIALPKKPNAKKCEDHRTISLMSHVLKIFLKILHGRIHRKCDESISETQFGFRNGLGTRDALFAMQVLSQRCLDMNTDIYACFIDFQKAFDNVQHEKLIKILYETGIDGRDIRIIANLYWHQSANIKIEGTVSESVAIQRGVRQGCILSPLLFNIYSEAILHEALQDTNDIGICINGETLNNIRYADDTVLLAGNAQDLQTMLETVNEACNHFGLKINTSKTKFMVISKNKNINAVLSLDNEQIEQVRMFKYLGCFLTDTAECDTEIRCRIEQARQAFVKMKPILCNRDLDVHLRLRMVRCYIFSILLYGVEGWTLTQAACKKLQAFEMWTYRRMLKIPWTKRVSNIEVLNQLQKNVEIVLTIKKRKLEYFGHAMRHEKYRLLQLIMQGKIRGARSRGRRKTSWLKNLREWYGTTSADLFRAAASKIRIAMMIANLR